MAFKDSAKSELQEIAIKSSKNFPLFGTSLASIESLSMPKVCIFTYLILGFDLCLGWQQNYGGIVILWSSKIKTAHHDFANLAVGPNINLVKWFFRVFSLMVWLCCYKNRFMRLFFQQICSVRSAKRGLLTLLLKWMVRILLF